MIAHLIHLVIQTVLHNQNQFAQGGLVLMVVGAIGASLRKVPESFWKWVVRQTTLSMTIVDESDAFLWFKHWYQHQKHSKKSRRVDVFTPHGRGSAQFTPAQGKHWFFYKGRPLVVIFERSEEKKGAYNAKRTESFTIKTLGRDQKFLRDLVAEIGGVYVRKHKDQPTLYVWNRDSSYWESVNGYTPRPLESVILPKDQKDRLLVDIERFKNDKDWYVNLGIPYHRGYVLYGPPGTGKTSLVTGLSAHFLNRVYLLKLNEHTDASLTASISHCAANSFIVLEDVDCVTVNRATEKKDGETEGLEKLFGVSLSGLLNAIDGMQAPSGVMFFMTTNHIDKLDPALLRPGRADVKEYIGPAVPEQLLEMYGRFFPSDTKEIAHSFIEQHEAIGSTMAEFQELLMRERNRRLNFELTTA